MLWLSTLVFVLACRSGRSRNSCPMPHGMVCAISHALASTRQHLRHPLRLPTTNSPDSISRVVLSKPPSLSNPVEQLATDREFERNVVLVPALKVVPYMHDMRIIQILENIYLGHDSSWVLD